ncbi:hypothetical protein HWC53_gp163 [Bacillus phage vB_BmeM-Goe8]|uniref:Uncharacterized protein n=1 Tax=Bacillus phage vB_BmeM-Goe8 TaxID=2593638 RepID=A0A516KMX0_9CAUD|nr:hypothetical protein HWC53_gp163 [Bacillus phage vB_BmeM-Goe8]QDP42926.1 hypothetical protein Goe8_c01530 [Bacillus phage vB_BmeM-Goe8]
MNKQTKMSLVKYAGDFWVTLADYTQTRDTEGYSDHASVKSAVRTFVVKQSPDKYIAFRGEMQLKNIVQENKNNTMFNPEDFQGTRTALIHWSMLDKLNERFAVDKSIETTFNTFMEEAEDFMEGNTSQEVESVDADSSLLSGRSTVLRQLRSELSRLDKQVEVTLSNREKLLQAINAIESLEIEEA